MSLPHRRVVKLGGSLLANPRTPQALSAWLEPQPAIPTLWFCGGGELVDAVRRFDERFRLSNHQAHWQSIRLLDETARWLQHWFPDWPLVTSPMETFPQATQHAILQPATWIRDLAPPLPESWEVTSDCLAGRLAKHCSADELVLLKSCPVPAPTHVHSGHSVEELRRLAEMGIVDTELARLPLDGIRVDCQQLLFDHQSNENGKQES